MNGGRLRQQGIVTSSRPRQASNKPKHKPPVVWSRRRSRRSTGSACGDHVRLERVIKSDRNLRAVRKVNKRTGFVHQYAKFDGQANNRYAVDFVEKALSPLTADLGVQQVLEQPYAPRGQRGNPPRPVVEILEMGVPGEGHEDIRSREQQRGLPDDRNLQRLRYDSGGLRQQLLDLLVGAAH